MARIENAITQCESRHSAEVFFCVENALPLPHLLRGQTARERASELFATLRVWDTGENNGILLYLLLAERQLEIVTDRAITGCVSRREWEDIAKVMLEEFKRCEFEVGLTKGLNAIADLLSHHFPPQERRANELNNKPMLL